jgi:hypothetical protein
MPVCGGALKVRVLQCPLLPYQNRGKLRTPQSRILYLQKKDLEFVELFVRLGATSRRWKKPWSQLSYVRGCSTA